MRDGLNTFLFMKAPILLNAIDKLQLRYAELFLTNQTSS